MLILLAGRGFVVLVTLGELRGISLQHLGHKDTYRQHVALAVDSLPKVMVPRQSSETLMPVVPRKL